MATASFDLGPKPKHIEGGCLCGALRYRVDFPENHNFAASSMICQCSQCRKGTASLFFIAHRVAPASGFRWLKDPTTLKNYQASPAADRGFCGECGSWLYWRPRGHDRLSIGVGTVDPLYLAGDGADGVEVPEGGFGRALASGCGQAEWTRCEIKGVTDDMPLLHRGRRSAEDDAADA